MDMSVITSIKVNDEYNTPDGMLDNFCKAAGMDYPKLDVCSTDKNAQCPNYFTLKDNALTKEWNKPFFCNSPYSKSAEFIKYGWQQVKKHQVPGIFLIFAKTETKYWQEIIFPNATMIFWIKGRVQFARANGLNRRCYKCKKTTFEKRCKQCNVITAVQNSPYGSAWVVFLHDRKYEKHLTIDQDGNTDG